MRLSHGVPVRSAVFDEPNLVSDAGLLLVATLTARLGLEAIMLRARVPVKVVSERLGHANVAITLDVYAHVTKQDDREAAALLGRVLGNS